MSNVSIIIPVYNTEPFLRRCIDSVLAQSVSDWECILVDDGSTDGSSAICDEYASSDGRIRVIHKVNGGAGSARNEGIKAAHSEWITFIDGDDYVSSSYLEDLRGSDELDEYTLYSSGIRFECPDGSSSNFFQYPSVSFPITDLQLVKGHRILANGCPVAKLFNRDLILSNDLSFNEEISLNEDHLFVVNYLCHIHTVCLIEKNNYHYWLDRSIPTLSRKRHDFSKHLMTAQLLHDAAADLCSTLHCSLTDIVPKKRMRIFGPQQIRNAAYASLFDDEPLDRLKQCAKMASSLKLDSRELPLGGGNKLVLFLLSRHHFSLLLLYLKADKVLRRVSGKSF